MFKWYIVGKRGQVHGILGTTENLVNGQPYHGVTFDSVSAPYDSATEAQDALEAEWSDPEYDDYGGQGVPVGDQAS